MRKLFPSAALALVLALVTGCKRERVCPADERDCSDRCVAVATDPTHCGACGVTCAAGETCGGGVCRCADGRADCGGACVDLSSDPANCGACGVACGASQVCTTDASAAAGCAAACALPSLTNCDRACVDTASNPFHCGACGRACGTNERCQSGLCVADLYLACFNTGELREATAALEPAGTPLPLPPGPAVLAWLGSELFVASSASGGGEKIWDVRFDPPEVRASAILTTTLPNADFEYLAAHDGLLYLAHASVGTLLVVAPDGTPVDEVPLRVNVGDPNPSPQGIAFVGEKAYVALNASNEVVVVDVSAEPSCAAGTRAPPCATVTKRIDVQPLASSGALAEPSRLAVAGGRLYVTLWNLDAGWNIPPGGTGRLAVIDTATDALDPLVASGGTAGLLDLGAGCLDPADLALLGETLFVTCGAFDYSAYPAVTIHGSGIVPIDLSGGAPRLLPIVEMSSSEAPGKLAFCGGTGYVGDRNSGTVFRFDPVARTLSGQALCPPANGYAYVTDLACGP